MRDYYCTPPYLSCHNLDFRSVFERWCSFVDASNPDGCWIWTGSRTPAGYGMLGTGSILNGTKKVLLAHRISLEMFLNDDLGKLHVLHLCDNPPCVNPFHLRAGTPLDNLGDASRKGRVHPGALTGGAKLNDETVLMIWAWHDDGRHGATREQIAAALGINASTLSGIALRKTWRHLLQ